MSSGSKNDAAVSAEDNGVAGPKGTVDLDSNHSGTSQLYEKVDTRFELRKLMRVPSDLDSSYEDLKLIGVGGVGAIKLGKDPALGRQVAIKMLHPELREKKRLVERLIREARTTAQIEHPSIAPVHDIGYSEKDGFYFTMKFVRGESLRDILLQLHDGKKECLDKYTLIRLLNIFLKTCQGVAFAHSRGAIHRDLKPENILIADFGEVIVLDWGLVRYVESEIEEELGSLDDLVTTRLDVGDETHLTVDGLVSGTPAYMSPEQAMGHNSEIDARSDVFSLGSILYEILTLASPFPQDDAQDVLRAVAIGNFRPPERDVRGKRVPPELQSICRTAMMHNVSERYQTVQEMIDDIYAFLEGRRVSVHVDRPFRLIWKWFLRRPLGTAITATFVAMVILLCFAFNVVQQTRYRTLLTEGSTSIDLGKSLLDQAATAYDKIKELEKTHFSKTLTPDEQQLSKLLAEQKAKADGHFEVAAMLINRIPRQYQNEKPVRDALRAVYLSRLRHSLKIEDYDELGIWVNMFRTANTQSELGPDVKVEVMLAERALQGNGIVTFRSSPSKVTITIRYLDGEHAGELVDGLPRKTPMMTPLNGIVLPKGSYILKASAPDHLATDIPLTVPHGALLDVFIELPRELPEGCRYVHGGDCVIGGAHSPVYRRHRRSVPGFFMSTYEVTFEQYLRFWRELESDEGRHDCMSHVYLSRTDPDPIHAWNKDGRLHDQLSVDCPVVGITHAAAAAFCEWKSRQVGRQCRLPTAEEWEKAARSVDGRIFPWGNESDASYAFTLENKDASARFGNWAPPGSFEHDRSVYGIMDLAGNVREWTDSFSSNEGPYYQIKGASSATSQRDLRCDAAGSAPMVPSDVGFRYVIPATEARF